MIKFSDRIEILNDDISSAKSLEKLSSADLIIMHNPFEWFTKDCGKSKVSKICEKMKSGAKVVALPPIESQNINVSKWLKNVTPSEGPWKDELQSFALYNVI